MDPVVLVETRGCRADVTLNRPEKLNCINWQMLRELEDAVSQVEANPEIRMLVISGAGDRAFSTGGDLKEFKALDREETIRWIRAGQRVFDRIESLPVLTVAFVRGFAYGGGLELALACDFRVVTPDAKFAAPELGHGWVPGWGALKRLPRAVGTARAKEMILLGDPIAAETALDWGLATHLATEDGGPPLLNGFLEKVSAVPRELLSFAKAALSTGGYGQSGTVETDVLASLLARFCEK